MHYTPTMLMGKKRLLSEAKRAAVQTETYAQILFKRLRKTEHYLTDLQKHIPENAPRSTSEHICMTMRKLEHHTKRIAKHADHLMEHVQKLDEAARHGGKR